nr:PREDICTED: serine/arginine repetitive matrix protein 1-like [Bemisia tabaci]
MALPCELTYRMLKVFRLHHSILIFSSLLQFVSSTNAEGAKQISIMCSYVDHGIIWCSKLAEETVEHWVSFLDETIDDVTANETLADLLRGVKTGDPNQKFLLTCVEKEREDGSSELRSCHKNARLTSNETKMPSDFDRSHELAPGVTVPENVHLIFVDFDVNDVTETHQLQARQCNKPGRSPRDANRCAMEIMRKRWQQGQYRRSPRRVTRSRSGSRTKSSLRQQRTVRRTYSSPNGKGYSRITTTTRTSPNGRRQTVVRRTDSRSPQRSNRSRGRSPPPKRRSPQRGSPGTNANFQKAPSFSAPPRQQSPPRQQPPPSQQIPFEMDYPESPPTRDRPLTVAELLAPNNSLPTDHVEDDLPTDGTPPVARERLSEPVDADAVTARLAALFGKNGGGQDEDRQDEGRSDKDFMF